MLLEPPPPPQLSLVQSSPSRPPGTNPKLLKVRSDYRASNRAVGFWYAYSGRAHLLGHCLMSKLWGGVSHSRRRSLTLLAPVVVDVYIKYTYR